MALIPWKERDIFADTFKEFEKVYRDMHRLFNLSLRETPVGVEKLENISFAPSVDVYEQDDKIIVKADLPGLKKEEIEVKVEDDTLVIQGEKKKEHTEKKKGYLRCERAYGSFYRAVPLSSEIALDKVSAQYRDGVLEVTLPKKEGAKSKEVKIDIK